MSTHSNQDVACQTCGGQLVLGNLFCDACRQMWGAPEGVKSADYGTRAVAYIIDYVILGGLSIVSLILAIVFGLASDNFGVFFIPLVLIWLGYLVWWVMLLRRSQTPGKLIMKLWVIRDRGQPAGWGLMFVREFFIKGLLFGILGGVTLYIAILLDLLWPLWDRKQADVARQDYRNSRCAGSKARTITHRTNRSRPVRRAYLRTPPRHAVVASH